MKLNLSQTKLIGLTMELELKTKEYKLLCDKLEKIKSENTDENSEDLIRLRDEFINNQQEIKSIKKQLIELKKI